jgi:hypothetical protein
VPRKYRNIPATIDGIKFDSQKEGMRYVQLRQLERNGEITELKPHPKFNLWAATNGGQGEPVKIGTYSADFAYIQDGERVVEDCKSGPTKTTSYRLRKKIVEANYNIEIIEV